MRVPRWLFRAGEKARAPLRIWTNLVLAAYGQDVGKFLDRKSTTPQRRLLWRVLLTLAFVAKMPVVFALLVACCVLVGALAPLVLIGTYSYGALREIWRG